MPWCIKYRPWHIRQSSSPFTVLNGGSLIVPRVMSIKLGKNIETKTIIPKGMLAKNAPDVIAKIIINSTPPETLSILLARLILFRRFSLERFRASWEAKNSACPILTYPFAHNIGRLMSFGEHRTALLSCLNYFRSLFSLLPLPIKETRYCVMGVFKRTCRNWTGWQTFFPHLL